MIPFIRSISELMAITESRDYKNRISKDKDLKSSIIDSGQRKRYIRSLNKKEIKLPSLPNHSKQRWMKSKEALSKFFNDLDYNNQIQPSYELTLLARQNDNNKEAA